MFMLSTLLPLTVFIIILAFVSTFHLEDCLLANVLMDTAAPLLLTH